MPTYCASKDIDPRLGDGDVGGDVCGRLEGASMALLESFFGRAESLFADGPARVYVARAPAGRLETRMLTEQRRATAGVWRPVTYTRRPPAPRLRSIGAGRRLVDDTLRVNQHTFFYDLDNPRVRAEIQSYLRYSEREARTKADGHSARCVGLPGPLLRVFMGNYRIWNVPVVSSVLKRCSFALGVVGSPIRVSGTPPLPDLPCVDGCDHQERPQTNVVV